MRGGKLNDARFGERMRGKGPRWQAIEAMFRTHCRRLGLDSGDRTRHAEPQRPPTFRRPDPQGSLF